MCALSESYVRRYRTRVPSPLSDVLSARRGSPRSRLGFHANVQVVIIIWISQCLVTVQNRRRRILRIKRVRVLLHVVPPRQAMFFRQHTHTQFVHTHRRSYRHRAKLKSVGFSRQTCRWQCTLSKPRSLVADTHIEFVERVGFVLA